MTQVHSHVTRYVISSDLIGKGEHVRDLIVLLRLMFYKPTRSLLGPTDLEFQLKE